MLLNVIYVFSEYADWESGWESASCTTLVDIESSSKNMIFTGWMWKSLWCHSF